MLIPFIYCKHRSDPACPRIVLPYSDLRAVPEEEQTDLWLEERYQPDWPPDEWSATFGCSICGFLSQYTSVDVEWEIVPRSHPGVYHSGANCFCIEFRCAQRNCKAPARIQVEKIEATERDILNLFRESFFIGTLPCGHEILSLPEREYRISKITDLTCVN